MILPGTVCAFYIKKEVKEVSGSKAFMCASEASLCGNNEELLATLLNIEQLPNLGLI